MYHISQGDDRGPSKTTNITVASSTFVRLALGVANDCEMPHFTPIILASCFFSPERFVAIFFGRSESTLVSFIGVDCALHLISKYLRGMRVLERSTFYISLILSQLL